MLAVNGLQLRMNLLGEKASRGEGLVALQVKSDGNHQQLFGMLTSSPYSVNKSFASAASPMFCR